MIDGSYVSAQSLRFFFKKSGQVNKKKENFNCKGIFYNELNFILVIQF